MEGQGDEEVSHACFAGLSETAVWDRVLMGMGGRRLYVL